MRRLLALTLLLSPALHAETYKWVDERGVVNYSNTPPPASAKAAKAVGERVSTYESDPALQRVAASTAPTPYEVMLQQEWLQRQRLMAERQNVLTVYENPPVDPYPYYYSSYYPAHAHRVSTVRRVGHRPHPHVTSFRLAPRPGAGRSH